MLENKEKIVYITEKEIRLYVESIVLPSENNPLYEDLGNTQYFLLEHCSTSNIEQFEKTFNIFLVLLKDHRCKDLYFKVISENNQKDKYFENLMFEIESEEYFYFDEDLEFEAYREHLMDLKYSELSD